MAITRDCCCGSIATGCKYQGPIFRFKENILPIKWSVNEVSSCKLAAKCGAIPKYTRVCKSQRQRCKRNKPSNVYCCFVAVQRKGKLVRLILFAHSCGIISDQIKCLPASVPTRHTDECITVVEIPYNNRSLYVRLEVRATSVDVGGSSRD